MENLIFALQNGNLICGGYESPDNCLIWTSGSWNVSHNLLHARDQHSSWSTDEGLLLVGGYDSPTTTEMLTWEGLTEERFTIIYPSE